jgi:DUF1680 family protein
MPSNTSFTTEFKPGLLNDVVVVKATVPAVTITEDGKQLKTVQKQFTAIPYYGWANRGKGEMMIWFPEKIKDVVLVSN